MNNIIFCFETMRVSGLNRLPFPFETEIRNVDPAGLSKQISYVEWQPKQSSDGKPVYLLPQPPLEEPHTITNRIETTEITDEPVLTTVQVTVPLMENGHQKSYQPTQWIDQYDEEGNITGQEEVSFGPVLYLSTSSSETRQKQNESGQLLYWKEVQETTTVSIPQPALEITADHPEYTDSLEPAMEEVPKTKAVSFYDNMNEFTIDDICRHKERQLISNTFYSAAILFETMDESLFSISDSSFCADLAVDRVSIPDGGELQTVRMKLPQPAAAVGFKAETSSDGLAISIGVSTDELLELDARSEVAFEESVSEVYVRFQNSSGKRIDLYSFALMV